MKKLIISLGFILLLLLVSPALLGQYLRYNITHKVPNKIWPNNFYVHVDSFKSGWFRSEATLTASQGILNPNSTTQTRFPIQLTFYHGPFIWTRDLTGQKHWFFSTAVAKGDFLAHKLPFHVFSVLHVFGHSRVEFKLENSQVVEGKITISIGKMLSNNKLYDHWKRVVGHSDIENAVFSMQGGSLVIPSIHADYNFLQIAKNLWLGHKEVQLPTLEFRLTNMVVANAQNGGFVYDLSADNGNVQFSSNLNLQKISYGNQLQQNLGPVIFKFNAGPFPQEKFAALMEKLRSSELNSNIHSSQDNFRDILTMLPGSLASMEVTAATQEGSVALSSKIEFPASIQFDPQGTSQEIWQSFSNQITANFNVSIPNAFLTIVLSKLDGSDKNPQLFLTELEKAQAIRLNGSNWETSIVYKNGHFLVNGIPMEQIVQQLKTTNKNEQPTAPASIPPQPTLSPASSNLPSSQALTSSIASPAKGH